MIDRVNGEYVVTVLGCVIGKFDLYDEALTAYLELTRAAVNLAF